MKIRPHDPGSWDDPEVGNYVALRGMVREDEQIELIIVHHPNGDNDFFSHLPEVEECERHRVIAICKDIIRDLEKMGPPKKRGGPQGCSGSSSRPGTRTTCPA